jgi:hypothetical protein
MKVEHLRDIEMTLDRARIEIHGPAGNRGVNFLLYDSGAEDENRMMIFGTTNSIASLSRSLKIHADGTFKVTPAPFKQLYVLHFEENEKLFPAAFILLSGKTRALYDEMLQVLQTLTPFQATKVITDYEFQVLIYFCFFIPGGVVA